MMMGRRVINRENKKIYQIIFNKIKVIGNRIENKNFTTGHRITKAIFPTTIIRPKANTNQIIPLKKYIKIIITTTHLNILSVRFFSTPERLRKFWLPVVIPLTNFALEQYLYIYPLKKKSPLNADVASKKALRGLSEGTHEPKPCFHSNTKVDEIQ